MSNNINGKKLDLPKFGVSQNLGPFVVELAAHVQGQPWIDRRITSGYFFYVPMTTCVMVLKEAKSDGLV